MFKIGEFARIAGVSIHMLRHYDNIALFRPSNTDVQSGYRYYSMDQLPRLHRIMALRDLGLTLEQIAQLLDADLPNAEIRGMLALKRAQVEQTIADEHARLRRIESRLQQLEHSATDHHYAVVCKVVPGMVYLSSGWQHLTDMQGVQISRETATRLQARRDLQHPFPLVLVHDQPTEDGLHNIEVGYQVQRSYPDGLLLDSGQRLCTRQLGVGNMASTVHHGQRLNVSQAYQATFTWMESNGYHFAADQAIRERYLRPTLSPDDPDNIVEIQVPLADAT